MTANTTECHVCVCVCVCLAVFIDVLRQMQKSRKKTNFNIGSYWQERTVRRASQMPTCEKLWKQADLSTHPIHALTCTGDAVDLH